MLIDFAQVRRRRLLLVAVTVVTLCAGLNPRNYNFQNNVTWMEEGNGIAFGAYGSAFTEPFVTSELSAELARDGFTLELVVSGLEHEQEQDAFAVIAQFYSGDEQSQWVLGQWSDYLIVMNGDDYRNRLHTPRITVKLPQSPTGVYLVTVTASVNGSRFYLDGQLLSAKPDVLLNIPSYPESARLVVGNSANVDHSWPGSVRGLAFYRRALDERSVKDHFDRWGTDKSFSCVDSESPYVCFGFEEQSGRVAHDLSGNGIDLHFPLREAVLDRVLFENPAHHFEFNWNFISDFVVNLFGFIPFGLALSLVLYGVGVGGVRNIAIVIVSSAALSGSIEFTQAWIPSRSSSALDLILNIAGGFIGAFVLGLLVARDLRVVKESNL